MITEYELRLALAKYSQADLDVISRVLCGVSKEVNSEEVDDCIRENLHQWSFLCPPRAPKKPPYQPEKILDELFLMCKLPPLHIAYEDESTTVVSVTAKKSLELEAFDGSQEGAKTQSQVATVKGFIVKCGKKPEPPPVPVRASPKDDEVLNALRTQQSGDHGKLLAKTLESMISQLYWSGSSGPGDDGFINLQNTRTGNKGIEEQNINHFAVWMREQKKPIPAVGVPAKMNCWECVFFAAFEAGLINYQSLLNWHLSAQEDVNHYHEVLLAPLNIDKAIDYNPGLLLQPGDIVFFCGYGCEHVALATGNHENEDPEILSLWHSTNSVGSRLELTSIEKILRSVKYNPSVVPCPF